MMEALERYHKKLCIGKKKEDHPVLRIEALWKKMHPIPESATITIVLRLLAMDPSETSFLRGIASLVLNHAFNLVSNPNSEPECSPNDDEHNVDTAPQAYLLTRL